MLHGVDVSSYQPDWTPASGDSFVFIKASESTNYRNPYRADQASRARKAGLVVGWYHFLHHGNIQAQADYFLATSGIQTGDLLVCDWEASGCTTADKDQFIRAVQSARPTSKVGLYCNTNWWKTVDTSNFYGDFLWIAAYQSSKPSLQTPITFWQYTDTPLDQNHGYFDSLADLKTFASGKDDPSGQGGSTTPVYPTADAIRTPYGQKGSSWASGYHQGDDWHRNAGQAEIGDPIYAVASGKIIYAGDARKDGGQGWGSAFGIHVLNQWDEHGRTSLDAHMSKLHVKTGDRVTVGQLIGEKGDTGNVSGPHDHHEQHTGTRWTDPDVKPIYPGKAGPPIPDGTSTGESEDFDVSEQGESQVRTKPQIIKPNADYAELRIEDSGDLTFGFGGGRYEINARFIISGLSAAEELMIRVRRFDTDSKTDERIKGSETDYWVQGLVGGGGKSYRQFEWKWHVPAPPSGRGRRLRLAAAQFTDHDVTIESIHAVTWKAPL